MKTAIKFINSPKIERLAVRVSPALRRAGVGVGLGEDVGDPTRKQLVAGSLQRVAICQQQQQ